MRSAAGTQRRRGPQLGMRVAHLSFTPPATRSVRSRSASADGRVGQRQADRPAGQPEHGQRGLGQITVPGIRIMPVYTGSSSRWMAQRLVDSLAR